MKLPKQYRITKDGKVKRNQPKLDASAKIRQRTSKKQKVVRRTPG